MSTRVKFVELRKNKKLSQEALARMVGVGRTFISMIESGTKCPSMATARKMAIALEVSLDELDKVLNYNSQGEGDDSVKDMPMDTQ